MEKRKFNPMYLVMNQVQKGKVPANSKVWSKPISDRDEQPLASWAANEGLLPEGFHQWGIYDPTYDYSVAVVAVAAGTLPADFDRWSLADENGWTVAHEAAEQDALPEDFDQWEISNDKGWTVAHVAAAEGCLPNGFNLWHLANNKGWTVAHVAAENERLPYDVSREVLELEADNSELVEDLLPSDYPLVHHRD
jgi:hypothetical protein